jgi:hypothetical protein
MELFESLDAGSTALGDKKTGQKYAAPAAGTEDRSVTFLDVHCGVSMGVMAGIDVGAAGRYEYLIMGQPMSDVAIAEGDAAKGELVISPEVHDFLHRYNGPGSQPASGQEGTASPDKKQLRKWAKRWDASVSFAPPRRCIPRKRQLRYRLRTVSSVVPHSPMLPELSCPAGAA